MTIISRAKSLLKDLVPPVVTRAYQRTIGQKKLEEHQATAMHAFFAELLPADSLCFDIGANVGNRVAAFRRCGFRVVAVEPQPACHASLRTAFGDDPAVTLINKAVGSRAGTATMMLSDDHIYSTLSQEFVDSATRSGRFGKAKWNKSIEVEVVTLDQLIADFGQPAFIKVDVEGFEHEVVRGLSRPVDALSLEWLPTTTDVVLGCLSHLSQLGPIRCNISFGESMKLATPDWVDPRGLGVALELLRNQTQLWGDVYVRSV